jgi:hypothetical protein
LGPLLRIRNKFIDRKTNEDIREELNIKKINKRTVKIQSQSGKQQISTKRGTKQIINCGPEEESQAYIRENVVIIGG